MVSSYNTFVSLINATADTEAIYNYATNIAKIPLECDDLLRWEWTQCVSAFDKLIHDLVRVGMVQIFDGKRMATVSFNNFLIDYNTFENMRTSATPVLVFEQRIILKHSTLSFQDPSKVADALSNIWAENDKWGRIASEIGMSKDDCKTMMKNIVTRRNQIVHEGDYINPLIGDRTPIFLSDVIVVKKYIMEVGTAIFNLVK